MIFKLSDCRVRTTLNVIRGKWKPIIIKALRSGSLGYAELRRVAPEPSEKVITAQLRELERDKIISRSVFLERIVRVEYSLTNYGWTIVPVLVRMNEWGQRHRQFVLGGQKDVVGKMAPSPSTAAFDRREAAS